MARTVVLAVCAALALTARCARADVTVMKDVTLGFGQALEHCREESGLTEEKMEEFFHFWRDDFEFKDRELGCALQCMSKRFNLLTDSQHMHHENTENFIKSFPNGEVLAKRIVGVVHDCEQNHEAQPDHCWRILRVAECFKATCKQLNIAPSVELIMVELIMETDL